MRHVDGTWNIGTKDNRVVYLERLNEHGDTLIEANLEPGEAKAVGQALIDKANQIDPKVAAQKPLKR